MLKQHEVDISCTYQTTSIGLEIHSRDELLHVLSSLQRPDCTWVVLHDRKRRIELTIYLRFREGDQVLDEDLSAYDKAK